MKHGKIQQLGLERIYRLFELAGLEFAQHPERSKRYVALARGISKKVRARIPDELKTKFCKKCGAFLWEGANAAIRKEGGITVVKCGECGRETKTGRKAKQTNK